MIMIRILWYYSNTIHNTHIYNDMIWGATVEITGKGNCSSKGNAQHLTTSIANLLSVMT